MNTVSNVAPTPQIHALICQATEQLERGDDAAAEAFLSRLIDLDLNQFDGLRMMGILRYRQGRYEDAAKLLACSIHAQPNQPDAQLVLGYCLREQGDNNAAISAFAAAIALDPAVLEAHLALARTLYKLGQFEEAEESYRKVLALSPGNVPAKLGLSGVLIGVGQALEAEAVVREAFSHTNEDTVIARLEQALGVAAGLQNRRQEQIDCYRRAQALDPRLTHLEHARASLLANSGCFGEAISLFRSVLMREPLNLAAHREYNNLLYCLGQDDEFLRSYDEAIELGSDPAKLGFAKATFLALAGRLEEALELYNRLFEADPANLDAKIGAALTLSHMKRLEPALEMLQDVLLRHPGHREYANLCGSAALIAAQMGEPQRAAAMAGRGLTADPHEQLCLAMLGTSYRMMNDAREEWLHGYASLIRVFELEAPKGYRDMAEFNTELNAYLDGLHTSKREFVDQSLRAGSQTHSNLFKGRHPLIERLRSRIDDAVHRYIAELTENDRHPFLRRRSKSFSYSGSWSSRLRNDGFHVNHVHTDGWISSCYYIEVPDAVIGAEKEQGWLKFGEPRFNVPMQNSVARTIQPAPGRLVLFPSYTWHGTIPFRSQTTRTTLAFDVIPK